MLTIPDDLAQRLRATLRTAADERTNHTNAGRAIFGPTVRQLAVQDRRLAGDLSELLALLEQAAK